MVFNAFPVSLVESLYYYVQALHDLISTRVSVCAFIFVLGTTAKYFPFGDYGCHFLFNATGGAGRTDSS